MKKAFALTLTLWIVAMLSLVSVLYLSYGRKVVKKTIELNKKLELTLEAESTIELLKFYIATGRIDKDSVVNSKFKDFFPSFPNFLYIDGREEVLDNRTIKLQDTAGLVNVYDKEAFANYVAEDLSIEERSIIDGSLRDWLDLDEFSSLNGAESSFYRQMKYAYGARDEDYITSIEELFLIRGIDKYKKIDKELLTLSTVVRRNILTMNPKILGKIYGFTNTDIEQLIESKREGKEFFLSFFYRLNSGGQRPELDGSITSNILKVDVVVHRDGVYKKIKLLINFRPNNKHAFKVLEYYD